MKKYFVAMTQLIIQARKTFGKQQEYMLKKHDFTVDQMKLPYKALELPKRYKDISIAKVKWLLESYGCSSF